MKELKTLPEQSRQRVLIQKSLASLSKEERLQVANWASSLIEIQTSDLTFQEKLKKARIVTKDAQIGKNTLKVFRDVATNGASASKRFWNRRSRPAKAGMIAAGGTALVFGSQGAGIAALGTAIGLPLWMVTGAGAMFAATLLEEAKGKSSDPPITYFVPEKDKNKMPKNG